MVVEIVWTPILLGGIRVAITFDQAIEDPTLREHGDAFFPIADEYAWMVSAVSRPFENVLLLEAPFYEASVPGEPDTLTYTAEPIVIVGLLGGLPAAPFSLPMTKVLPP